MHIVKAAMTNGTHLILSIRVGPGFDEQLDTVCMTSGSSTDQRSLSSL